MVDERERKGTSLYCSLLRLPAETVAYGQMSALLLLDWSIMGELNMCLPWGHQPAPPTQTAAL